MLRFESPAVAEECISRDRCYVEPHRNPTFSRYITVGLFCALKSVVSFAIGWCGLLHQGNIAALAIDPDNRFEAKIQLPKSEHRI